MLERQYNSISSSLNEIKNQFSDIRTQSINQAREIDEIRATSIIQGDCLKILDRQIQTLTAQARSFTEFMERHRTSADPSGAANVNIENLVHQIEERFNRSRNVLIFNYNESDDEVQNIEFILNILIQIGLQRNYIVLRRIGRKTPNKTRPLLLTLKSRSDVLLVLRNRRAFPQGTTISDDKTKEQRDRFNALRREVYQHNQRYPNDQRRIRFINGIPTVISVNHASNVNNINNPSTSSSKN